jgi:hypothetical protein
MVPQAERFDDANASPSNVPGSGKNKMTITVCLSFDLRDREIVLVHYPCAKGEDNRTKAWNGDRFLAGAALVRCSSSTAWPSFAKAQEKHALEQVYSPRFVHLFGGSAAARSQILGRVANKIWPMHIVPALKTA